VSVSGDDRQLRVRVTDTGPGGAHLAPPGGLAGLADRVRALGGSFTVTSTPAAGTHVTAVIPCG
jgi:signal transduction histidine kinase